MLSMTRIYLASGNAHKVSEFQCLADAESSPVRGQLELVSAKAVGGMPIVVEDTGTFAGNAGKKARALWEKLGGGVWVLADDSGLCVEALGGRPGVESAYYAGPQGDSAANLQKLVEAMRGVPIEQRGAYFICVLFLITPEGKEHLFEGRCEGVLIDAPLGGTGFGYDPLFVPAGHECTFAQLGDQIKNNLSHRAAAWKRLLVGLR